MSGFVYFIAPEALFVRHEETQFVKIGYTRNSPESRLSTLQTGCPHPLKVYLYTDGPPSLETAFHDAFAPLRWIGEWFYLQHKLFDFMHHFDEPKGLSRYVPHEQIEVSLYDNLICDLPPHPSVNADQWRASADFTPLRGYYPTVLFS